MNIKKLMYYPMKTTVIYLLFTILLFVFGPIRWKIPSYPKLICFLLVYIIAFALGYMFQAKRKLANVSDEIKLMSDVNSPKFGFLSQAPTQSIMIAFTVSCIYSIIHDSIMTLHLYGSVNFSDILNIDIGASYFERLESEVEGTWYVLLLNFSYVLSTFWYILGIIYFKKLSFIHKGLFLVTLVFNIIYNAMGGALISWAIFVFRLLPIFFLELYKTKYKTSKKERNRGRRKIFIIVLVFVAFIILFSYVQEARLIYAGRDYDEFSYQNGSFKPFIKEEKQLPVFNTAVHFLDFYLVHGYCGMAYALELSPKFTYGIGYSRDLAKNVNTFFDVDVAPDVYPQRLENAYGWENGFSWPSAYTWFASDWTFYGIPLLMFLFGMLLCSTWYSALYEESIIGLTLTSWLWIGIVFIPANNQLFQSLNMFMATTCLLIMFAFRKSLPKLVLSGNRSKFRR